MSKRLGVALSGGGHRAALWASGALLGLADAEANRDVVSVASVSGGSITNGLVAASSTELALATTAELEAALQPGFREWAGAGLFFTGPGTDGFVAMFFFQIGLLLASIVAAAETSVAMGRGWTTPTVVAVSVGGFVVATAVAGLVGKGLPGRFPLCVVAGAALSIVLGLAGTYAASAFCGWALVGVAVVTVIVLLAVAIWTAMTFERRSVIVEAAMARGLFKGPTGPRPLASLASKTVHHVFCATNLVTANHLYLSPRLIYGDEVGSSAPGPNLSLATAVQASACLPGAFAPRALEGKELGVGLKDVVLNDGGVYDNMADQWEFGFANRTKRFASHAQPLSHYQSQPAEQMIVVNASKAFSSSPLSAKGPLGELAALMRCSDVLYDQSTATRRRYLVDMWDAHAKSGDGLTGVLVHIAQEPTRVPAAFANSPDPAQRHRASEAQDLLTRLRGIDPIDWAKVADANAAVATTLAPVGVEVAARLLHHACVLTRINLYVILGRGSLPPLSATDDEIRTTWGLARFRTLIKTAVEGQQP